MQSEINYNSTFNFSYIQLQQEKNPQRYLLFFQDLRVCNSTQLFSFMLYTQRSEEENLINIYVIILYQMCIIQYL
jgi:hypothetical protein